MVTGAQEALHRPRAGNRFVGRKGAMKQMPLTDDFVERAGTHPGSERLWQRRLEQ